MDANLSFRADIKSLLAAADAVGDIAEKQRLYTEALRLTNAEYSRVMALQDKEKAKLRELELARKRATNTADLKEYQRQQAESLKNLDKGMNGVGGQLQSMNNGLRNLRNNIVVAFVATQVVEFGQELARVRAQAESFAVTLEFLEGSAQAGAEAQEYLRNTAERLGVDLMALTDGYKQLKASTAAAGLTTAETRDIFDGVTQAMAVMQLKTEDQYEVMRALSQIMSKGTVQAEELRGQIGERIPGAFELAAKAMGMTTQELNKQLQLGQVMSKDFLPAFSRQLQETYGGGLEKATQSLSANLNRQENAVLRLKQALSEGLSPAINWVVKYLTDGAEQARLFTERLLGLKNAQQQVAEQQKKQLQELEAKALKNPNADSDGSGFKDIADVRAAYQQAVDTADAQLKKKQAEYQALNALILDGRSKDLKKRAELWEETKALQAAYQKARDEFTDWEIREAEALGRAVTTVGKLPKPLSKEELEAARKAKADLEKLLNELNASSFKSEYDQQRTRAAMLTQFRLEDLKQSKASAEQKAKVETAILEQLNREIAAINGRENLARIADAERADRAQLAARREAGLISEREYQDALEAVRIQSLLAQREELKAQGKELVQIDEQIANARLEAAKRVEARKLEQEQRQHDQRQALLKAGGLDDNLKAIEEQFEREVKLAQGNEELIQQAELRRAEAVRDARVKLGEQMFNPDTLSGIEGYYATQLNAEREYYDKVIELRERLGLDTTEIQRKASARQRQIIAEQFAAQVQLVQQYIGAAGEVVGAITSIQVEAARQKLDEYDRQQEERNAALDAEEEAALQKAGDNADKRAKIEKQFADRRKQQEREAAAERRKLEEETRRREERAYAIQRLIKAAEITGNTAMAISKAVAASPLTFGMPWAAVAAAVGAAQLAAVLSTPAKFRTGVIDLQGPGTGDSDSIAARLSRGESVMTARETAAFKPTLKAIRAGRVDADLLNRVATRPAWLPERQAPLVLDPSLFDRIEASRQAGTAQGFNDARMLDQLERIEEVLRNPAPETGVDADAVYRITQRGNSRQKHLKDRYGF